MPAPELPPEARALQRQFAILAIVMAVLTAAGVSFGVAYIYFHKAWALPGIFAVVALGLAAQVRFVLIFRGGKG